MNFKDQECVFCPAFDRPIVLDLTACRYIREIHQLVFFVKTIVPLSSL